MDLSDSPSKRQTPITKHKLLNKLSFVYRSEGDGEEKAGLQNALYEFAKELSEKLVSRQTITYWFDKNSAPSRGNAYIFLSKFIEAHIKYEKLQPEQKRVYHQILAFIKMSIREIVGETEEGSIRQDKIYTVSGGNIAIRLSRPTNEFAMVCESLSGLYLLYRTRLSEGERRPLVQEVLKIYRRQRELRFEHWYLRNGKSIDRFDGAVTQIGDVLWFLGASKMTPDRFRVMAFRKNNGHPEDSRTILWGIMLSDGAAPSANEPGACRVLLCGVPSPKEGINDTFLRNHLKFVSETDETVRQVGLIWRLVNNKLSAVSEYPGTQPVSKQDGSNVIDAILKVDQSTLSRATIDLQD